MPRTTLGSAMVLVIVVGATASACGSFGPSTSEDTAAQAFIVCGSARCAAPTPICCGADTDAPRCVAKRTDCDTRVLQCDDRRDCEALGFASNVCCATLRDGREAPTWPVTDAHCATKCPPEEIEICDLDVPGSCATGTCTRESQKFQFGSWGACE